LIFILQPINLTSRSGWLVHHLVRIAVHQLINDQPTNQSNLLTKNMYNIQLYFFLFFNCLKFQIKLIH